MTPAGLDPGELCVLILAPRGRDAAVAARVLADQGVATSACRSLAELGERLDRPAGAVLATEEALTDGAQPALIERLDGQPPWSDLPIIVLATKQSGRRAALAAQRLARLGNLVLLERPLHADTLISAVASALRARARQYQVRASLEEQARINADNVRLNQARVQALQQAAEAREALALALDAAELGTFHCPMPLGAIVWNDTCKAHFWLPRDAEVDFDLFYSLIHPDDRPATETAITAAIDGRQPYDVEYRTLGPQGAFRWIRAKGRAYYGADGAPLRFDGITIDISVQKQLQAEREAALRAEKAAREEAERVSRMKDEFLATLSHELRTPLSAILGWTQLMRRPALPVRDFGKGVEVIERNARAQARLIEELLDMSRIIAGNMRLNIEPIEPAAVVEAALASVQPAAAAKGIAIRREIDGGLGPIAADPHRLQQMLWNLLSNAVKFTPGGGEIEVALRHRQDALEFAVADSGEGIAADFLPFVFDRFRQADASTTRDHGGLGLGLAIVRHLAELHGGTVAVSSDGPGRGARFIVCLPLIAAQAADDGQAVAARTASALLEPPTGDADLSGLTIVAVDDEADGRELLARLLTAHGARIVSAGSAEEALAAIEMVGPDLLISDIAMPRVDGHELLHRVRALRPTLPAIALSAFARADDRRRALEAGYRVHLAKPVDVDELLRAIALSLQREG